MSIDANLLNNDDIVLEAEIDESPEVAADLDELRYLVFQGQKGADGRDGADGVDGAPGASAYEIAVENGFVGTEEEWLASLKGADGEDADGYSAATPEQFGAKGDGMTDDTAAIQAAVDSGYNVAFAFGKTYKCGQINVTKNIEIDCCWSNFLCTGEILFNCTGEVTDSIDGADYVAFDKYALPNDDTYTGMAFIRSTENTIQNTPSLRAGFAALFRKGICSDRLPSSFGNVTVDKVKPITCHIANVGNVVFDADRDYNALIKCTYGLNCLFENIEVNSAMYSVVWFYMSRNCVARNANGYNNYFASLANYYTFLFSDSSFCGTENCKMRSEWWHTWATGGYYYCYQNYADDCDFSVNGYAYSVLDHACGIGTRIHNCIVDCINVGGDAVLEDVRIRRARASSSTTTMACAIRYTPTNLVGANHFTAKNIKFLAEYSATAMTSSNYGIIIRPSQGAYAVTSVIDGIHLENIRTVGTANNDAFSMLSLSNSAGNANTTLTINGTISIDNVQGLFHANASSIFDQNKCKLVIRNCHRYTGHAVTIGLSNASYFPKFVSIENCTVGLIRGNFNELNLVNVDNGSGSSLINAAATAITKLTGVNIAYVSEEALLTATKARILGMEGSNGADKYSAVYVENNAVTYVENISNPPTVPSASSAAPQMDGTAAAGSSADYSRADHVHPTDTSRLATTGNAYRALSIPFGQVDSTSTSTVFTATIPGITELRDGVCMWIRNGVITSGANFTLNINGLGAKPCYSSLAAATRLSGAFNVNYTYLMIYNSSRVDGGCWDVCYGYDSNTTYTTAKLGFCYLACSTAEATLAKTANNSSYALNNGGILVVRFTNAVPANSTLNVSSKGAFPIKFRNANITDGIIKAGDTVGLIYYSSEYHLFAIDRWQLDVAGKLDTNQGASNAGKFMVVGSDGNITAVTMTAWQGGSY